MEAGMKFESTNAAVEILQDTARPEGDRIAAIHYLAEQPTQMRVDVLANTLGDDTFAVRWAAANALCYAGSAALRPVLRVLISQGADVHVRESACHALCENTDPHVRAVSRPLIEAMKGPGADVAAPKIAFDLLRSSVIP